MLFIDFKFSEGPPADEYYNIISPEYDENNQCTNGWICEQR